MIITILCMVKTNITVCSLTFIIHSKDYIVVETHINVMCFNLLQIVVIPYKNVILTIVIGTNDQIRIRFNAAFTLYYMLL